MKLPMWLRGPLTFVLFVGLMVIFFVALALLIATLDGIVADMWSMIEK